MVCFYVGRDQKNFVSPENYGDWRSARSRSSVLAGNYRGDLRGNQPLCRVHLGDEPPRAKKSHFD